MSIEDAMPPAKPDLNEEQTASEQWGSWGPTEGGMPVPAPLAPPPPPVQPQPQSPGAIASSPYPYAEYATGSPPPAPPYGAYSVPYGYPAGVPPAQGRSDGYLTGIAVTALVCSILAILAGLFWLFPFVLTLTGISLASVSSTTHITTVTLVITIITFTCMLASFVGGGFTIYHSIRALMRKPSAIFRVPAFWVFLLLYIAVVGVEYALYSSYSSGQDLGSGGLTLLIIALLVVAAVLPAFILIALGLWRLRAFQEAFTWRRMLVSFASGITFAVSMALYMEYTAIVQLFSTSFNQSYSQCLIAPALPICQNQNPQSLAPLLTNLGLLAAIVAIPLIDEFTKPLLLVTFMGKVRSAAEAFAMGLVCGAGFGLIEALFLVGAVYNNWAGLTLITSSLVIVQGFGAAMGTLGWYYMTRTKTHRARNALVCWACALLQHVLINAILVSSLLPDPIGSTVKGWLLNVGTQSIPANVLAYTIGVILILALFIYIAGRLRKQSAIAPVP
ncbi:MAG: hypothetical protein M3Z08_00115 [Chloroflexota bacterium]|nr:hypothetical protein [Chloroflexota bacterium]